MDILHQSEPTPTFEVANETRALPLAAEVSDITRKETTEAVTELKHNKATSWDEITGELLKHSGEDLVARLAMLLNKCWKEQSYQ